MVLRYDNSQGIICVSLSCAHTIIPDVLSRPDFWFLLFMHASVAVAFRTGWIHDKVPNFGREMSPFSISWDDIKVVSTMTTFFEVFYTNQAYLRYERLYAISGQIISSVCEIILTLRLHLANNVLYAHLAARFTLSSTYLTFLEVNDGDITDKEFAQMVDQGLLRPDEKEVLEGYGNGNHEQLLLYWIADVAREGLNTCVPKPPSNGLKMLMDSLLSLRAAQTELLRVSALPIPFQYYHLLNTMVLLNLVVWGYAMAIVESMWASVTYLFSSIIFMGMLELADKLLNPFGDDDVDFPSKQWLDELIQSADVLLHTQYCPPEGWAGIASSEKSTSFLKIAGRAKFYEDSGVLHSEQELDSSGGIQWPWLMKRAESGMPGSARNLFRNVSSEGDTRLYHPLALQENQMDEDISP